MNAAELRRKADAAFRAKKFDEATALYTQASPARREKRAELSGVERAEGAGPQQGFECGHMLLMQSTKISAPRSRAGF